MKAVITVVGKDRTGIIARVSGLLYENGVNILDISQTIMQELFTMIMLVEISGGGLDFSTLKEALAGVGDELGVLAQMQREDIFDSMHRI